MAKFSVKKPLTVFVVVLAVVVLGVVAYLRMTPDLLPNMDFPYVVIVTADPGASPELVEEEITRPMEQSMATLDQIKEVTSTSQNSVSMVMLQFEDGVNMDTISVDIQQKISVLQGQWDDMVGAPYVLKINPSMIPVMVAAVSQEGTDVYALSDLVTDELTGKLEGVTGVASVTVSGALTRQAHVILDQEKMDALSATLEDAVKEQLKKAESQLYAAQKQVTDGEKALSDAKHAAADGGRLVRDRIAIFHIAARVHVAGLHALADRDAAGDQADRRAADGNAQHRAVRQALGVICSLFQQRRGIARTLALAVFQRLLDLHAVGVIFKAFGVGHGVVEHRTVVFDPRQAVAPGVDACSPVSPPSSTMMAARPSSSCSCCSCTPPKYS